MIEQLTPSFRFICDRCGKKYDGKNGEMPTRFFISFSCSSFPNEHGEVCEECYKDFCELAESFFDDLNKTEKGGAE